MAPPQYQKPPQAPPLFTATTQSIAADSKRLIAENKALEDELVKDIKPEDATFANVCLPQARHENEAALEDHILGFYQSVATDAALRDASTAALKEMDESSIESAMREDIFKLVAGVANRKEALDPESQRWLEKVHKSYLRNGLGLPAGEKRDRFKAIKKKLSELSIEFSRTLNEENGGLWFTEEELDSVPKDLVATWPKGEGENAGKVFMSFKYPDLFPTLKYATNSKTRQKVFVANENKCPSNVPLFKEAITLRDEAARLLGYNNHAEFRLEDKMAKVPKTVNDFLGDLRERLAPGGITEIKALLELKKADLESHAKSSDYDGNYYLWDHRYYDRLMLEKNFALDQEKIAEYFPLDSTIRGMLHIFEELFGLVFVEITGEARDKISPTGKGRDIVWHDEVQVFSVWDDEGEGSGFVGYLYLDLFPRPGKYGHAANFNLQPGFISANGTRRYPATALVCNFSKPTPKKPSLLKHDEVVTLFHELGHGIHDLVSRTTFSRFHGTNTVRDFVEAPSQMLENWCWTPSQLRALSKHYSTVSPEYAAAYAEDSKNSAKPSDVIPDDLIDSIVKTKHVNDALFNLRQLHFGIFDMTIHSPASHAEVENLAVSELYNRLRKEISKIDGPEAVDPSSGFAWGNGQSTFGHLMGGYDVGYYGYLSSQVYSTDMFYSVFKADPMNGKEGRRYRHTVLERGGSQDEMQTLKDFLGRAPSTEAFYEELGITKA
ncbi:metallopeptidase [Trichodelitschia bisporula]|uniref:Metallopeptidase n=1 Tax=Trichodelitschia bisporula TaxID=703511 RepID=A0A6G1I584_9PEZI|nr:metallopeptidase [Trichodelitschia bisporula]